MRRLRRPSKGLMKRLAHAKAVDWRRKAAKAQDGRCFYCSAELREPAPNGTVSHRDCTLDHKLPLSRGGEHHWENVVASCLRCNREKGDKTVEEFKGEGWVSPTERVRA